MSNIIKKILQGDKNAVVIFYNHYSPKISRYLQNKISSKEDLEELLQDVFLDALDSLAFFQGKSSVTTWLTTIAHHKMVDYYRKRKIKSLLLSQLPFLQPVAREITQPEFQFEKNRVRDKIEITLHMLSEKYRIILHKHYVQQISVKQIAVEMNLSFKATESLLYRARQDFIKKYEEE